MSELILGSSAPAFADTLSVSGLETLLNAQLATLLTNNILGIGFTADDQVRGNGTELKGLVNYDQAGTTITHPYLVKGFFAATVSDLVTQVAAFMAANPTYFFSPTYLQQLSSPRRQQQVVALVVYNTSLADGEANWFAGGNPGGAAPGGPAGGDLSGTYPNPSVFAGQLSATPGIATTTLDSVAIATYKTMVWEVEAIKGTNTYSCRVNASHDGTTPVWVISDTVLAPDIGTFDITVSVDISGANMRLLVATASTGWTLRARQITRLAS